MCAFFCGHSSSSIPCCWVELEEIVMNDRNHVSSMWSHVVSSYHFKLKLSNLLIINYNNNIKKCQTSLSELIFMYVLVYCWQCLALTSIRYVYSATHISFTHQVIVIYLLTLHISILLRNDSEERMVFRGGHPATY